MNERRLEQSRLVPALVAACLSWVTALHSAPAIAEDHGTGQILIKNVRIFDGKKARLSSATDVWIVGNKIERISTTAARPTNADAAVIDGAGRILMPGLIESHAHLTWASTPMADLQNSLPGYEQVVATAQARDMLMRGVTSVRDMGGPVFGLKRAIDEGIVPGPRIYPSGTFISQTSGHGDFRQQAERHALFEGQRFSMERKGHTRIVDGVPLVLAAVRENLRHGATQIKLMVGGGYASQTDPLESTQFSFDEIKAAVDAAADFGTYVAVHVYTPRGANRAIDAGVKVIEHGQLLDEKTLKRMAKEGVWLSTQPFTTCHEPQLNDVSNAKLAVVCKGTEFVYKTIKKFPKLKVTYGTDIFNDPVNIENEVKWMDRLSEWHSPGEILIMATGTAGELLKLSGIRDPYPGDLGVVKEGALADLLLVDGNPLEDVKVVGVLENLRVIIKDGQVYKNTL
jgi:imidazolonepropionase-like amidohydrolase